MRVCGYERAPGGGGAAAVRGAENPPPPAAPGNFLPGWGRGAGHGRSSGPGGHSAQKER